jgi:hypothetical protein
LALAFYFSSSNKNSDKTLSFRQKNQAHIEKVIIYAGGMTLSNISHFDLLRI